MPVFGRAAAGRARWSAASCCVAALLVAAVAWGSTVVVTKSAFATLSPLGVVSLRLILTGITLALMFPHRLRMPLREAATGAGLAESKAVVETRRWKRGS